MRSQTNKAIKDLLCRETEKPVLEQLYIDHAVPSGQLRRDSKTLTAITTTFNRIASRDLDEGTLLRYIFNRRKQRDWPRLESRAKKFTSAVHFVAAEHEPILQKIYEQLDESSDDILFDKSVIRTLAQRFHEETDTFVSGPHIVAFIFAKRKRGEWVKTRKTAFSDIDEVAARTA